MDREYYLNFFKFVKFYMNHMYRINIDGIENIPTDTNYLLAGNHLNILDSWLLGVALEDEILRFMVDVKLYRYKSWENFFKKLGTFSIDPNQVDLNAIKTAINLLKEEEKVVIFPEGKTHSMKVNVPFKGGIPKIANMANVPIIPFGINGSYRPFSELNLTFGEPLNLNEIPRKEWDIELEKEVRVLEKQKKKI